MLMERNKRIKNSPQRFQDSTAAYDIIITCEERCFNLVCDEISERRITVNRPVHLINFDITDTPEDAMVGARSILALATLLEECEDLDRDCGRIVEDYAANKSTHKLLYTVMFY